MKVHQIGFSGAKLLISSNFTNASIEFPHNASMQSFASELKKSSGSEFFQIQNTTNTVILSLEIASDFLQYPGADFSATKKLIDVLKSRFSCFKASSSSYTLIPNSSTSSTSSRDSSSSGNFGLTLGAD